MEITKKQEICFPLYFGQSTEKPSEKLANVSNTWKEILKKESKRLTQKAACLAMTPTHTTQKILHIINK
jgi:hypothetical protein